MTDEGDATHRRTLTVDFGDAKWQSQAMNRKRVSATVDAERIQDARSLRPGGTDASLLDEALRALLERHRSREIDASYAAYDLHPVGGPDAWGDLASWRAAADA